MLNMSPVKKCVIIGHASPFNIITTTTPNSTQIQFHPYGSDMSSQMYYVQLLPEQQKKNTCSVMAFQTKTQHILLIQTMYINEITLGVVFDALESDSTQWIHTLALFLQQNHYGLNRMHSNSFIAFFFVAHVSAYINCMVYTVVSLFVVSADPIMAWSECVCNNVCDNHLVYLTYYRQDEKNYTIYNKMIQHKAHVLKCTCDGSRPDRLK